MTILW